MHIETDHFVTDPLTEPSYAAAPGCRCTPGKEPVAIRGYPDARGTAAAAKRQAGDERHGSFHGLAFTGVGLKPLFQGRRRIRHPFFKLENINPVAGTCL